MTMKVNVIGGKTVGISTLTEYARCLAGWAFVHMKQLASSDIPLKTVICGCNPDSVTLVIPVDIGIQLYGDHLSRSLF